MKDARLQRRVSGADGGLARRAIRRIDRQRFRVVSRALVLTKSTGLVSSCK